MLFCSFPVFNLSCFRLFITRHVATTHLLQLTGDFVEFEFERGLSKLSSLLANCSFCHVSGKLHEAEEKSTSKEQRSSATALRRLRIHARLQQPHVSMHYDWKSRATRPIESTTASSSAFCHAAICMLLFPLSSSHISVALFLTLFVQLPWTASRSLPSSHQTAVCSTLHLSRKASSTKESALSSALTCGRSSSESSRRHVLQRSACSSGRYDWDTRLCVLSFFSFFFC